MELFQSTRPVWGATTCQPPAIILELFQSTRPVWGATTGFSSVGCSFFVSIHAPRVGRDERRCITARRSGRFNPRAPCGARPMYVLHQ